MKIDDRLHLLTTIVDVRAEGLVARGTGFFYHVLGAHPEDAGPGWRPVESIWLVTNRHVLFPRPRSTSGANDERMPLEVTFRLRSAQQGGGVDWVDMVLGATELADLVRLHEDPGVDVALVDVTECLTSRMKEGLPTAYQAVSDSEFPGANKVDVGVASDVVIVGYPKGFYDDVNKFPIVKSGLIASKWGAKFQGESAFLIDAKLFPGSSGSLVLSKPVDVVVENGQIFFNADKQFCVLGIFSGEPYRLAEFPIETEEALTYKKEYFDVGTVWYYYVIPEILASQRTLRTLKEGRAESAVVG